MDEDTTGAGGTAPGSEARKELNEFFEHFFTEVLAAPQSELFYSQKAAQLQDISPDHIPVLTRRLQKADWAEQDALVQLLARFRGVGHVSFLQEFVGREAFMPKTGMKILDIFNKSDVIIAPGVAGHLLEYDSFAQRIAQAALSDAVDDTLAGEFLACDAHQREGILAQILEDYGPHCAPFLVRLLAADKKAGERMLNMLEAYTDEKGFRIMEAMYAADRRKDILKRMKKVARVLGQRGIAVSLPESKATDGPVFQSAALAPARAFASTIDPEGFRLLFIFKPVSTHESKVFHIITSDAEGIAKLDVFNAYRGESSHMIKKLLAEKKPDFREVDTAYCVALVIEARDLSQAQNRVVPATMSQLEAACADDVNETTGPRIYQVINADEIAAMDPVPDNEELIEKLDLAYWYLVSSEAKTFWKKISRLAAETQAGDKAQLHERLRTVAAEERAAFFTAERKQIFKRRLEEFAYILHCTGDAELARAALAAALKLGAPDHDPERDPLCVRIIDRAFEIFRETLDNSAAGTETAVNG